MDKLLPLPNTGSCEMQAAQPESMKDNLSRKKRRLESQLKDTNDALAALENNPEVAKVLELVLKAGRF